MGGILFYGDPDNNLNHRTIYRGVPFILDIVYTDRGLANKRKRQLEDSGRHSFITEVNMSPESTHQHFHTVDVMTGKTHMDGRATLTHWVWKTEHTKMGRRRIKTKTSPKSKRKCGCKK